MCRREEFKANCMYNEALLITSGTYGHLYLGRCIPRDFGHFGCQSDVLSLIDARCSGKRSCAMSIRDPELEQREPECARDLVTFLEVSYHCVTGMWFGVTNLL